MEDMKNYAYTLFRTIPCACDGRLKAVATAMQTDKMIIFFIMSTISV